MIDDVSNAELKKLMLETIKKFNALHDDIAGLNQRVSRVENTVGALRKNQISTTSGMEAMAKKLNRLTMIFYGYNILIHGLQEIDGEPPVSLRARSVEVVDSLEMPIKVANSYFERIHRLGPVGSKRKDPHAIALKLYHRDIRSVILDAAAVTKPTNGAKSTQPYIIFHRPKGALIDVQQLATLAANSGQSDSL